jgi:hypothetical protein
VISDPSHTRGIESIASSKADRTVVPFADADIEVLKRELQRATTFGRD